MNISISKIFNKKLYKFLIFIVFLQALNTIAVYFLPSSHSFKVVPFSIDLPYYSTHFADKLQAEVKKEEPKEEQFKIKDLILKAIYANTSNKKQSFIVLAEKNKEETYILSIGESAKGYKFIKLNANNKEAIFLKHNRKYTIYLDSIKERKRIQNIAKQIEPRHNTKQIDQGSILAVSKKDVLRYARNFKSIWKNIAISEIVKNGKIDGFLITRIKRGTLFSKLGLQEGDIIKSANNNPLRSYADAFKIFNKISKIKNLKLTILRGKEQKDIEYEMY